MKFSHMIKNDIQKIFLIMKVTKSFILATEENQEFAMPRVFQEENI